MIHFTKVNVERIMGITAEFIPAEAEGKILVSAFLHSGQGLFHRVVDQFFGIFLSDHFLPSNVQAFLVVVHQDATADIYANDFPVTIKILAKRDLQFKVRRNDIADITELRFENIDIAPSDCICYCFKVGWKFGLFFDFRACQSGNLLDVAQLYRHLGSCYRYLAFQDIYDSVADTIRFEEMRRDGWFPFIQLIGGDFEKIASAYSDPVNRVALIKAAIDGYDRQRIQAIVNKWGQKDFFRDKKPILNAGIEAYLTMTDAGYITCIKTLLSDVEGIMRLGFFADNHRNPSFADLASYVHDKANQKFITPHSLGFPSEFYQYIEEVIFQHFHLDDKDIELSRHSASHGVVGPEKYTRERAFQAILILDQLYFFIGEKRASNPSP